MRKRSAKEIDAYKKKWSLPPYNNRYNQSYARWCLDNGYRIYREPVGDCIPLCHQFKIIVEKDGIKKMGTKVYSKKEINDAIWDAISYIYIKHGKKT
jgi:hypothetical protein